MLDTPLLRTNLALIRGAVTTIGTALDSLLAGLDTPPANQSPVLTVNGPTTSVAGSPVVFNAVASDPENQGVTVAWFVNQTAAGSGVSFTLVPTTAGSYVVTAVASDPAGATAQVDKTLTVTPVVVVPPSEAPGLLSGFDPGPKAAFATFPIPGAVQVAPSSSLAAIVAAAAPGTVFELLPGTHKLTTTMRPKADMQFVGHGPSTILDGQGLTFAPGAFVADQSANPARVKLSNFVLQNVKQPTSLTGNGTKLKAEKGAIEALDVVPYEQPYAPGRTPTTDGWVLERLLVTGCTIGATLGTGCVARDCIFNGNDGLGMKMWGDKITVEGCDMSNNNVALSFDVFYEAGGNKSWKGDDHTFRNCRANGNGGSGFWCDYTGKRALMEHVEAKGNTSCGISLETSIGPTVRFALVADNLGDLAGNGRDFYNGGIHIYSSPNTIIEQSDVSGGIIFQIQERGLTGWKATPNGVNANVNGEVQSGGYGARIRSNKITTTGQQWTGERVLPQRDYGTSPYLVTAAQLKTLVADMQWINNTYLGNGAFCYAVVPSTDPSWSAQDRHYTDLAGWKALGRG